MKIKLNLWTVAIAMILGTVTGSLNCRAGEPDGYYDAAKGKSRYELKTALHQIIKNGYKQRTYDQLWEDFKTTDVRADGKVWDMYGDCEFTFGSDKCGNYSRECDCYNREHSFPKSWFNDGYPMYTDLFHLYPTDGKVNGMRSNYPFGENEGERYAYGENKLGESTFEGFDGVVFEPADQYKGDFARTYFYMATRYQDKIASWGQCQSEGVCNGTSDQAFTDWTVAQLLKWHREDPVSEKEIARNDAVYGIQKNRNPFIDYPELVEKIWGDDAEPWGSTAPTPDPNPNPQDSNTAVENHAAFLFEIAPNPAPGECVVTLPESGPCVLEIFSQSGALVKRFESVSGSVPVRLKNSGLYLVRAGYKGMTATRKLVVR